MRELIMDGIISITHVRLSNNLADPLTKGIVSRRGKSVKGIVSRRGKRYYN